MTTTMEPEASVEALVPLARLARDVRASAAELDRDQVRMIVDLYYRLQEHRIALGNQYTALTKDDRPHDTVGWYHDQVHVLEKQVVSSLTAWTDADEAAFWAKSQLGIGPVLAAGCCAHIDITRAPMAGSIWRFFGLDPTVVWGKGEKRPWNADAKVLAWKIGDSFVKVSGRDNAFYGKLYRARKEYEVERDLRGGNSAAVEEALATRKFKSAEAKASYESGHLPAGRLDLRARRYAVKMFLAHLHEVMTVIEYDRLPPLPYAVAHLDHVHEIPPPGAPERVRELRREAGRAL